jgi:hypothetical protein
MQTKFRNGVQLGMADFRVEARHNGKSIILNNLGLMRWHRILTGGWRAAAKPGLNENLQTICDVGATNGTRSDFFRAPNAKDCMVAWL